MDKLIEKLKEADFEEIEHFEIDEVDENTLWVCLEVSDWVKDHCPADMFFCSVWS